MSSRRVFWVPKPPSASSISSFPSPSSLTSRPFFTSKSHVPLPVLLKVRGPCGNANLISKVYFPRLIIPAAAVATAVVDFAITLGLLAALMVWYGVAPGWELLALPVFVAMAIALSLGVGVCLAALNVEYRDFRYIVPFVVQFGLFISPIAFTLSSVPERWQALLSLNPMVGIIEGFRWSILGNGAALNLEAVALSTVVTSAAVLLGVRYFRRMERSFADVI